MLIRALSLILFALLSLPSAKADAPVTIDAAPTRLFGYQLGDVVLDRADIRMKEGLSLDPNSLPKLGKRFGAFTVRRIYQESRPSAPGYTHILLTVEMQLINTPPSIKTWTVPAIQLKFLGNPPTEAAIPSLTVDVAPLNTGEIRSGLPEAMPLRNAPLLKLDDAFDHLKMYGAVSAVVLLWFLLTLLLAYRRRQAPRPFRDARRHVMRALHHLKDADGARAAFVHLHRAFDDTWGRRLFRSDVDAFCKKHGADENLTALTQHFYKVSEGLFFGHAPSVHDEKTLRQELRALLGLWAKLERKAR